MSMELCGSCELTHEVEDDPTYCVKCNKNFDSGCMNEIKGEPVCFPCSTVREITLIVDNEWYKAIVNLTNDVYDGEICEWTNVKVV